MPPPTYNPDEILTALRSADYTFVLEKAMPQAIAGNADAQCTLALMYEGGLGVERNVVEAERWLLQATKQNSALAWNNLGTLYATKHPELKSRWSNAQECWKRAAELGFDCAHPYPPS
jgi:TPR repeat protein